MILHRFANGDLLQRYDQAIVVCFAGRRRVLSTAPHNGGYREDLQYVFNHDCKQDGQDPCAMKAPTYAEHMAIIAADMGLNNAAGISTAASMDNVSIQSETYMDTTVTAVVTGGIDVNGGRVGDPAAWHETSGGFIPVPGTINIMLFIDADLPEGTLARVLVTCTEAKTAALQELLAPSCYSNGIATGSGTDGTIIVSNPQSAVKLTWAGKHCKLGELIGRTVMAAVKEALFLQTGLCAHRQFHILERIGRFGVTKEKLWSMANHSDLTRMAFFTRLDRLSQQSELVVYTSLYVHLLDQLQWGLIGEQDAFHAAQKLLQLMRMNTVMTPIKEGINKSMETMTKAYAEGTIAKILACDLEG